MITCFGNCRICSAWDDRAEVCRRFPRHEPTHGDHGCWSYVGKLVKDAYAPHGLNAYADRGPSHEALEDVGPDGKVKA